MEKFKGMLDGDSQTLRSLVHRYSLATVVNELVAITRNWSRQHSKWVEVRKALKQAHWLVCQVK